MPKCAFCGFKYRKRIEPRVCVSCIQKDLKNIFLSKKDEGIQLIDPGYIGAKIVFWEILEEIERQIDLMCSVPDRILKGEEVREMPKGYEEMRDQFIREGLSTKAAKRKAAKIWNKAHPGNPVGRYKHEDGTEEYYTAEEARELGIKVLEGVWEEDED